MDIDKKYENSLLFAFVYKEILSFMTDHKYKIQIPNTINFADKLQLELFMQISPENNQN